MLLPLLLLLLWRFFSIYSLITNRRECERESNGIKKKPIESYRDFDFIFAYDEIIGIKNRRSECLFVYSYGSSEASQSTK